MDPTGEAIYFSDRFRLMVEDHLLIIRNATTVRQFDNTDLNLAYRFTGDFYGFLSALGYPVKYQWTIMRINGFSNRFELNTELGHLLLPDWPYIDKLAQLSKEKRA